MVAANRAHWHAEPGHVMLLVQAMLANPEITAAQMRSTNLVLANSYNETQIYSKMVSIRSKYATQEALAGYLEELKQPRANEKAIEEAHRLEVKQRGVQKLEEVLRRGKITAGTKETKGNSKKRGRSEDEEYEYDGSGSDGEMHENDGGPCYDSDESTTVSFTAKKSKFAKNFGDEYPGARPMSYAGFAEQSHAFAPPGAINTGLSQPTTVDAERGGVVHGARVSWVSSFGHHFLMISSLQPYGKTRFTLDREGGRYITVEWSMTAAEYQNILSMNIPGFDPSISPDTTIHPMSWKFSIQLPEECYNTRPERTDKSLINATIFKFPRKNLTIPSADAFEL